MMHIIYKIIKLFKRSYNKNSVAFVKLDTNILKFINYEYSHSESFQEIKELFFTKEKLQKSNSITEIFNLIVAYQKTKYTALSKIKSNQDLTFLEVFLIERLLMKFNNSKYISVEEHLKIINNILIETIHKDIE